MYGDSFQCGYLLQTELIRARTLSPLSLVFTVWGIFIGYLLQLGGQVAASADANGKTGNLLINQSISDKCTTI